MKRSIVWPPRVIGGRLAMTPDPASDPVDPSTELRQVIRLNLLDPSSSNPWAGSDFGTPDQTYHRSDGATRARLASRIRALFRRLERTHRAKLAALTFPVDAAHPSRLTVRIEYTSLESGTRESMEIAPNV